MQTFFGILLIFVVSAFFVFELIALVRTFIDIARNKVKSKKEVNDNVRNANNDCIDSGGDTISNN